MLKTVIQLPEEIKDPCNLLKLARDKNSTTLGRLQKSYKQSDGSSLPVLILPKTVDTHYEIT